MTKKFMEQWRATTTKKIPILMRWEIWVGRDAATNTRTQKYEKYEGYKHIVVMSPPAVQFNGEDDISHDTWEQLRFFIFSKRRYERNVEDNIFICVITISTALTEAKTKIAIAANSRLTQRILLAVTLHWTISLKKTWNLSLDFILCFYYYFF